MGRPQQQLATVDLMWIGFFWLLRPSEYLFTDYDHHPFTLHDVILETPSGTYRTSTNDLTFSYHTLRTP